MEIICSKICIALLCALVLVCTASNCVESTSDLSTKIVDPYQKETIERPFIGNDPLFAIYNISAIVHNEGDKTESCLVNISMYMGKNHRYIDSKLINVENIPPNASKKCYATFEYYRAISDCSFEAQIEPTKKIIIPFLEK